nr:phosphotransferase [Longispora sp. (in: high G+C Gram-positive bacteria)]
MGVEVVVLPVADTEALYSAITEADLLAGAKVVCGGLGLASAEVVRFPEGTLPVYAVGANQVLKLYPQYCRPNSDVEERALRTVEGRLSIHTPRIEAVGEVDGWGYLLMDRVPGVSLAEAWPHVPSAARRGLVEQLGIALAELHALAPPILPPAHWETFIAQQR